MAVRSILIRTVTILGIVLAILVVLLAALRLAAGHAPGRWLADRLLSDRQIGEEGRVRVSGIHGDVLGGFRVEEILVEDGEGAWLRIANVEVDWLSRSVLRRPLVFREVHAEQVELLRLPKMGDGEGSGGLGNLPAMRIHELEIGELIVAEGIVGPASRFSAEGEMRTGAGSDVDASLSLVRLDEPGDRLEAEFSIDDGQVTGRLAATGAPDGPFAAILRLEGQAIVAEADLAGDTGSGRGQFRVEADGAPLTAGELEWSPQDWLVTGTVDARHWEVLPETYHSLADDAQMRVEGRREPAFALTRAQITSASVELDLTPQDAEGYRLRAHLQAPAVSVLTRDRVTADTLVWTGTVRRDGLQLDGAVQAEGVEAGPVQIARLAGPLNVVEDTAGYRVTGELDLHGVASGHERLQEVFSDRTRLELDLHWSGDDRIVTFNSVRMDTGHATLEADGRYPLEGPGMSVDAELVLDDSARLHDMASGPLRVSLSTSTLDAAELEIDARAVQWPDRLHSTLEGLTATALIERREDGWRVPQAQAQAPGLRLELTAQATQAGWQTEGDLALSGQLPLAALEADGAVATAFRVTSEDGAITTRSVTTSRTLGAGPVEIVSPRLALETRTAGGETTADWVFTGDDEEDRPIALAGTGRRAHGQWTIDVAEGSVGAAHLTGSVVQAENVLTAQLAAQEEDRADVEIAYRAPANDLRGGVLDAELAFRNITQGPATFDVAMLSLNGPLAEMELQTRAAGRIRSRFDLIGRGRMSVTENGVAVTVQPAGKWSIHSWSAPEPLVLRTGPEGSYASASLVLGDGRLDLVYDTAGEMPVARLAVDDLPVAMLADIARVPAGEGLIDAGVEMRRPDGVWRGDGWVEASGLASSTVQDMPRLNLRADLSVQDDARLAMRLSGGGLDAHGTLTRFGPTENLFALAGDDDSRIEGEFHADGSLVPIAGLYSEGAFQLRRGTVDAEMTLQGTRGNPQVAGRLAVNDGHLIYPAYASTITDITLAGRFTNRGLQLDSLSANDGGDGRLSGSGELRLTDDGWRGDGAVDFTRFHAARNADLVIEATGDAGFDLNDDRLLITGEAEIDELRARPQVSGTQSIPTIHVEEINLPKDRRAYNGGGRLPIVLDYRVRADDSIYIGADNFSTEWRGNIHITGPLGNLRLRGRAPLLNGSAFVFNQRFRLSDGFVRFDGRPQDARINIYADYRRADFQATARVTGRFSEPAVSLSSDPSLPEDEILARLLFDRSVSELGAFEAAQLAAQLSGRNLLDVVGQLRDLAGIDRLTINTDEEGELQITGGRRIGDDVYVELGTSATSALSRVLVEWQLTPSLSLLSVVSADTDATVSVRWRRDY